MLHPQIDVGMTFPLPQVAMSGGANEHLTSQVGWNKITPKAMVHIAFGVIDYR